jgi:hypothetical protein
MVIHDFLNATEHDWSLYVTLLAALSLVSFFIISSIRRKNKEKEKRVWKFKNYEMVKEYLITSHPNLKYADEDNSKLVILMFFGWDIKDESNINEVFLERHLIGKIEKMTFIPKTKIENTLDMPA